MKKFILIASSFLFFLNHCISQHVGIGTETPQAMLDINGDVVFRTAELPVTDSLVIALDVNTSKYSSYRITAADSAFIIAGITAGMDGRLLTLLNQSGQPMTLTHEDVLADPINQIVTPSHASIVLDHMGALSLQYDSIMLKWVVHSTNQSLTETVWDTTGNNIYFENYVGIGTESPTAPLSIETALDEVGFSHMAGEDSITVASSVSALSGAVGTTSNHMFSLQSNDAGAVHILPSGNVIFGTTEQASQFAASPLSRMPEYDSKVTVFTPLLEAGYTHIGGDNEIIFNEAIGGVAASIGTMSNHTFRLKTNGTGKLNIYPDGRVWIGPESAGANAPLTIWGTNNNYGLTLLGESDQMYGVRVGGPGGSVGMGTYTPHNLRMVCNGSNAITVAATSLNVGIGVDFAGHKLEVNGTIRSKELIIETVNWPDYVFDSKYELRPLEEVEQYIAEHHHLPNIPAASELEANGLVVGEMQKKMMEKIEELTLYIIEQDRKIRELEIRIDNK